VTASMKKYRLSTRPASVDPCVGKSVKVPPISFALRLV
jgi:hypothetical protein